MTDSEKSSPENAFALLGNENRIRIIQAFDEASEESLSFSTLRSYANVDDSGQFNYHLNQLVGSFVRRTEGGEYELTYAGQRVIGAIFSGTFNQHGASLSFKLDSICSVCESALLAEYKHERVTISCPTCEEVISAFGFPPGAFANRSHDELARSFHSWIQSYTVSVFGGLCPNCAGRMCGSIIDDSTYFYEGQDVGIEYRCERCNESSVSSIGIYLRQCLVENLLGGCSSIERLIRSVMVVVILEASQPAPCAGWTPSPKRVVASENRSEFTSVRCDRHATSYLFVS